MPGRCGLVNCQASALHCWPYRRHGFGQCPSFAGLGSAPKCSQPWKPLPSWAANPRVRGSRLKAYWRGPADISVPSPDAPNPDAVNLHDLLRRTARRPPLCSFHMAARRPSSQIPGAAARRPALRKPPQHGASRKGQRLPDYATPPKRARVHANSHPTLSTITSPPASDLSPLQKPICDLLAYVYRCISSLKSGCLTGLGHSFTEVASPAQTSCRLQVTARGPLVILCAQVITAQGAHARHRIVLHHPDSAQSWGCRPSRSRPRMKCFRASKCCVHFVTCRLHSMSTSRCA